jgi:hypothetical protein
MNPRNCAGFFMGWGRGEAVEKPPVHLRTLLLFALAYGLSWDLVSLSVCN